MAEKGNRIDMDIDAILQVVKHVRAKMRVMDASIEGYNGGDNGYFEAEAMVDISRLAFQDAEKLLDIIIADLRKGGAKDYDMNDKVEETTAGD